MITVPYKGQDWPVSDPWAEKHLAGPFAGLASWETGSQADSASPVGLWGRLWAILRKSDETFSQRTAGMTHAEVAELMRARLRFDDVHRNALLLLSLELLLKHFGLTHDEVREMAALPPVPAEERQRVEAILTTLTPEETRELRSVEAHIIIRRRADFLLGRDLAEFDIHYIDHAHGVGCVPACGCDLLSVEDQSKLPRAQAGEDVKFLHAHYPRTLCGRHAHLHAVVAGAGRWHNLPLADRLEHVRETVIADNRGEAQPEAAAA